MRLPQPYPGCFGELRTLAQVLGHQLVLGGEVAIERHLVGAGRLGDGIDPNRPYSLSVKQVARSRQDPRAGRNSVIFSLACLISGGHGMFPLTRVLPVSTYLGVTGQYHKARQQSPVFRPPNSSGVTSHEPSRSHRATKPGSRAARRPQRTVLTLSP